MTAHALESVRVRTDEYFNKTSQIARAVGDARVTYAVFLRADAVMAAEPAIGFLENSYPVDERECLDVRRAAPEGALVDAGEPLLHVSGSFAALAPLETVLLQKLGWACVSARNAYEMCRALPDVAFLDMHARHATGDDMSEASAYGAAVGSRTAQLLGAKGFVGGSQGITARHFGLSSGVGTMPHALVGYMKARRSEGMESDPPTLAAAKAYEAAFPEERNVSVLVDFDGREISDAIEVCDWFYGPEGPASAGKTLSFRLDTHGGRHMERLDWNASVETLKKWTHRATPSGITRQALDGVDIEDVAGATPDGVRDKHLFGTGVTAAAVVAFRKALDDAGYKSPKIVASSGFDPLKCRIFANLDVPVDVIGTGSYLPKRTSESHATADAVRFEFKDGGRHDVVKAGREHLLLD